MPNVKFLAIDQQLGSSMQLAASKFTFEIWIVLSINGLKTRSDSYLNYPENIGKAKSWDH